MPMTTRDYNNTTLLLDYIEYVENMVREDVVPLTIENWFEANMLGEIRG